MKEKVIAIVCVVLVIALTGFSVQLYHNEQTRAYLINAKEQAVQAAKDKLQHDTVEREKARIKAECDKANAYYDALPAKTQATLEAPNCYLDTIE